MRLFQDCNLTPIDQPNPDPKGPKWIPHYPLYDTMDKMGFEKMFMVYDGTMNRSKWWMDDNLEFKARDNISGPDINLSAPPDHWALKAVAKLAKKADRFRPNIERNRPIIFDFEPSKDNWFWEVHSENLAHSANLYRTMADTVRVTKDASNWQCMVGAYGWPFQIKYLMGRDDSVDLLASTLDFVAPCFYTVPSWNPDSNWFSDVQRTTAYLDQFFGHLPKIGVLCLAYQVWWKDSYPEYASMNNQPVPMKLWTHQIKFLKELGYSGLMIWTGDLLPSDQFVQLLTVAKGLAQ